jgi:hypothetical protein
MNRKWNGACGHLFGRGRDALANSVISGIAGSAFVQVQADAPRRAASAATVAGPGAAGPDAPVAPTVTVSGDRGPPGLGAAGKRDNAGPSDTVFSAGRGTSPDPYRHCTVSSRTSS